jgi:hypothetical protein
VRALLLAVGLLLSCAPDATDNPTTRCETDRACAADSFCYRGFCVADAVSGEPGAQAPASTPESTADASETEAPADAGSAAPPPMLAPSPAARPPEMPQEPPEMPQEAASPDASARAEPTCSGKKCCEASGPAQDARTKRCDCADAAQPKCDGDGAEQKK